MWIFTKYGFFSVVSARTGKGKYEDPIDPTKMMIRARDKNHLENLIKGFSNAICNAPIAAIDEIKKAKIEESQWTDYPFRIFISKDSFILLMTWAIKDINYDNFKHEVDRSKITDKLYYRILERVWSIGRWMER